MRYAPLHYLQVLWFRTYAELRTEVAKTFLGILWWILDPILFMFVFYVVFAVLLERRSGDFVSFLLVGLVVWRLFANTIGNCAQSILSGKGLMQQVYLPKSLFPLVAFLSNLFKYSIVFVLLLGFLWWRGYEPTAAYWALIPVMAAHLALSLGVGVLVACMVPLFPDLRHVVSHLVQMMFFLSGVFYSGADLPADKQGYFYLNPMAVLIELHREILLDGVVPSLGRLVGPATISLVMMVLGFGITIALDRLYPLITKTR